MACSASSSLLLIFFWFRNAEINEKTAKAKNITQIGRVNISKNRPSTICIYRRKFDSLIGPRIKASKMGERGKSYFWNKYPRTPMTMAKYTSNMF